LLGIDSPACGLNTFSAFSDIAAPAGQVFIPKVVNNLGALVGEVRQHARARSAAGAICAEYLAG